MKGHVCRCQACDTKVRDVERLSRRSGENFWSLDDLIRVGPSTHDVTLDGRSLKFVVCAKVGDGGWVLRRVENDEGGRHRCQTCGQGACTEVVRGDVRVVERQPA